MNNIRLSFAVDADDISLKSICKKDFLELQMRAISTANPNLNGSWFTKDSLLDAVESCKNKPILGYFNTEGDFESHNGTWKKDVETGLEYWDTSDGETMLGMIRESDEVKVVDGEDGLSWLCLSCALWTQYNFKQVKRLFKDAKKAKETGGVTKNISVEIDIKEGEKLDNGIYRIDKFNLLGITILGSRNGKKVLPGIENAALSIPEIIGTDFYAKQERSLRAAYSRLEENGDDNSPKEDVLDMTLENNTTGVENTEESGATTSTEFEQAQVEATADEAGTATEATTETEGAATEAAPAAGEPTAEAGTANFDGDVCPKCGKNPCECEHEDGEGTTEQESCAEEEGGDEAGKECHAAPEANIPEVRDVLWLTQHISYGFDSLNETIHYYEFLMEQYPDDAPHGAYIISVLKRCLEYETRIEGTLGGLLAKIAGEITEADEQYEAKLSEYSDVDALIKNYEAKVSEVTTLTEERDTIKEDLKKFEQAEFLESVNTLLTSANLAEDVSKEIYEACKSGAITKYEDAKVKVALAVFDAKQTENVSQGETDDSSVISTPVDKPNVHAAFEGEAEKPLSKRTRTDILREYCKK